MTDNELEEQKINVARIKNAILTGRFEVLRGETEVIRPMAELIKHLYDELRDLKR